MLLSNFGPAGADTCGAATLMELKRAMTRAAKMRIAATAGAQYGLFHQTLVHVSDPDAHAHNTAR